MQFNGAALVLCISLEMGWVDDGFYLQTLMRIFFYILTTILPIIHSC